MDQKQEIEKQNVIEDEKPQAKETLAEKLKRQKREDRRKLWKKIRWGSSPFVLAWLIWFLFAPYKASAEYGLCHTVLELNVPYPHTIHVGEIKYKKDGAMELWYTYIDAFGEYRMEPFRCRLGMNPETNRYELLDVRMHKVSMSPEKLASLNNAMPYFAENPVILNYPVALPDSIGDLKFEVEQFRRVNLSDLTW